MHISSKRFNTNFFTHHRKLIQKAVLWLGNIFLLLKRLCKEREENPFDLHELAWDKHQTTPLFKVSCCLKRINTCCWIHWTGSEFASLSYEQIPMCLYLGSQWPRCGVSNYLSTGNVKSQERMGVFPYPKQNEKLTIILCHKRCLIVFQLILNLTLLVYVETRCYVAWCHCTCKHFFTLFNPLKSRILTDFLE